MAVVLARLKESQGDSDHESVNQERKEQFSSLGRGTRVRSYNFTHNKVKDERVKKKFRPKDIMAGRLDLIYEEVLSM
jgi:protein subunit release factor A